MDPNQTRPNHIGSIDLEFLRSSKTITSREVDNLDKYSRSTRRTIKSPTITASKNTPRKGEALNFHEHETIKLDMPHDDALVIALEVGGAILSKFLSIPGVLLTSFHKKTLWSLEQPAPKIRREAAPLTSFEGRSIHPLGVAIVTTKACDLKQKTKFTVVDLPMPFDAIVGRPWLHQMRVVPSVYPQCVKFVSPTGEKTILGSQKKPRACYVSEFRKMPQEEQNIPLPRDLSVKDSAKDLSIPPTVRG
ncbi:hypothetical protein DY000_02027211 [Brassica cretica]|uniref:Uncharacterized protein n=1 Tax=Brassica cretica TaxID=69181 RepID=A0ABQ7EF02_BRACR|nr:hypothetical protein DY000_02027211 [Brassica cretica]